MFTGIVQELGKIINIDRKKGLTKFTIYSEKVLPDINLGGSVLVNGVCLTVTEKHSSSVSFEVITETIDLTNLRYLANGDLVNLENSLTLEKLVSGHLVTGHVDGLGKIDKINKKGNNQQVEIFITLPEEILKYIVKKGSVAVDGISLTVTKLEPNGFWIYLIPVTFNNTNFNFREKGDLVNIEIDLIIRYLEKIILQHKDNVISKDFLKKYGFF